MPRLLSLFLALVATPLVASQMGCGDPTPARALRSVIVIGVDTLRADHLGLYGSQRPTSPALDEIAGRARVFEHAYATSAWTLPSFASLLTGLGPNEHGAGLLLRHLDSSERAEWQEVAPERITGKQRTTLDPAVETLAERLQAAGFATLAVVQSPNLDPAYGVARGFDKYLDSRGGKRRNARGAVARALELAKEQAGEPFFLFLHVIDPHLSYHAPEPAAGRFTDTIDSDLRLPVGDVVQLRKHFPDYPDDRRRFIEAAYDEEVAFVDEQIARLLAGLQDLGLEDEILFIFTSDHGEEFAEHGGFEHGHSMHQEVLHVPFMVWGPGVRPGREAAPVSIADVAPTVLEAVGLSPRASGFGRSLWPLLARNQPSSGGRLIVASGTVYGPDQRMALRWPYKLIQRPRSGELALYNLLEDPGERRNLTESHNALAQALAAELEISLRMRPGIAQSRAAELDAETIDNLRELGYLE